MGTVNMFGVQTIPTSVPIFIGGLALALYLFYRWAMPRPIPGIPYNKEATKSILGDIPSMVKHVSKTQQVFDWIVEQNVKLNSPVIQLWARPFSRPWVVVTDFRESQDILMRRTKEFDRSQFFGDIFHGLFPDHHISMKTNDTFKAHRALVKDLMTPAFLHEVAAPQIYTAALDLIRLWREKSRLANGYPFAATDDINHTALDAVWAATFGSEIGTTKSQLELLSSLNSIKTPPCRNDQIVFPVAEHPPAFQAILTLTDSLTIAVRSPAPSLHHWFLRQLPYMRAAIAYKDRRINEELEAAKKRFMDGGEKDQVTRCAMDDILRREIGVAKKEGREPVYNTRTIHDELFGFLVGGHETTSTTLCWGLKMLADNPDVQTRLRSEIHAAFPKALSAGTMPTAQDITKSKIPYLEAVIEEIVRCSGNAPGVMRSAMIDTEILGYSIPKGTDVFLLGNGPGFFRAPFLIDEEKRSESCRTVKNRVGSWDPQDMTSFLPERWLEGDEKGNVVFNSTAGPHLNFGLGPRGCFGRRMAYLEMHLVFVLLIWNLELQKVPENLSSYDAEDKLTHSPKQCYVKLNTQ